MMRFTKMICLLALLGFCGALTTAYAGTGLPAGPEAGIQAPAVNSTLFVDLRADDLTTQSTVAAWLNHGTLGDFASTNPPTVGAFDYTRGVYFNLDSKSMLCADYAPAGLLNNSDWSVEYWAWSPALASGNAAPVVAWGDRPSDVIEFDYAGSGQLELVTYTNGDNSWPSSYAPAFPAPNKWNYVAVTFDPATSTTLYLNGVRAYRGSQAVRSSWIQGGGALGTGTYYTNQTPNPGADNTAGFPISVGQVRNWNGSAAGWGGYYTQNCNTALSRVRIWDGTLSAANVLNNYDVQKAEYATAPAQPPSLPLTFWRKPLSANSAGKVMEFGDLAPGGGILVKDFEFKNTGAGSVTVGQYSVLYNNNATSSSAGAFKVVKVNNGQTTGTVTAGTTIKFQVQFTPTSTNESSATLVVPMSGQGMTGTRIWLRANVNRIYVANTGNDTTGNGTSGNPYLTLVKAIGVAQPGGVIEMANGTYGNGTVGAFAAGDRQVRITSHTRTGPSDVVILSTTGGNFSFQSDLTGGGVIGQIVYPILSPTAIQNSTVTFECVTITNNNSGTPLMGTSTGTFDFTLYKCIVNNTGATFAVGTNGSNIVSNANFARMTLINTTVVGGNRSTDNGQISASQHTAVQLAGNIVDMTATNCDFRRSYTGVDIYTQNVTLTGNNIVTLNNCLFGADYTLPSIPGQSGGPANIGVSVNPGVSSIVGSGDGVTVAATNCTFDGFYRAINSTMATTLLVTTSNFVNCSSRGIYMGGSGTYVGGASTILGCQFNNPNGYRDMDVLPASVSWTLNVTDCTFTTVNPASTVREAAFCISSPGNTAYLINVLITHCWMECGATATGLVAAPGVNPACILVLSGYGVANLQVDRCTLLSRNRVTTPSPNSTSTNRTLPRPSVISLTGNTSAGGSSHYIIIENNLMEGASIPIAISGPNTLSGVVGGRIINNTIIASSDAGTSFALAANSPTAVAAAPQELRIRNNIILGYGNTTYVDQAYLIANPASCLVNNWTLAQGDPKFLSPSTFALPANGAIGVNKYALTALTPVGAYPTGIVGGATNYINSFDPADITGLNRTTGVTPSRYDIGAWEYKPAPNPVKTGWTWY